jgi:glycopeptide antibiotics resistance protein
MTQILPVFKKFIIYWLPAIFWALLIFTFSSSQLPMVGPSYWPDFVAKKTAHVIEYAIFSIFLYRALKGSGVGKKQAMVGSIIIAFLYAVTDEMHQSFIPVRTARARDVFFDTFGAALSAYYLWRFLPRASENVKNLARKIDLL